MKTRRIDRNYRPLELVRSLEPIGSVPSTQMYDSEGNTHTPDYTLVPLILQPKVSVHDAQGTIVDSDITGQLTNCKWYEINGMGSTEGTPTQISTGDNYTIGENNRLFVKKNLSANTQITIRFEADYVDPRTSQINHVVMEREISCTNATTAPPVLDTDCPETFNYNPLRDKKMLTITARLMHGTTQLTTGVGYVWEKKRSGDIWSVIGTDTHHDLGFSLSQDGSQLTQDLSLMGTRLDLRIRATYPAKPTLGGGSPIKFLTLIRRMPSFDFDFGGVIDPEADVEVIYPRLTVIDHHGVVKNATGYVGGTVSTVGTEQKVTSDLGDVDNLSDMSPIAQISDNHVSPYLGELKATWKRAAGVAAGNPTYEECGYGDRPSINTDLINGNGMIVGVEVEDRGPRVPVTTDDGNYYLVDASGKKIVNR